MNDDIAKSSYDNSNLEKEYYIIISNRLNQLQNLQSNISNIFGTLTIAGFGLVSQFSAFNLLFIVKYKYLLSLILFTIILWGHLYSLYQYNAVKECVKVLTNLEDIIVGHGYEGHKYLGHKLKCRYLFHFWTHSFPSILFLLFPTVLAMLNVYEYKMLILIYLGYFPINIIILQLFKYTFSLK